MLNALRRRAVVLASIILLAQAGIYFSLSHAETIPRTEPWSQFPAEVSDWRVATESYIDADILARLQPDDYVNRMYVSPSAPNQLVNFFVAYFKTQRRGLAPHSPGICGLAGPISEVFRCRWHGSVRFR
jgi:hypothetical protein